METKENRRKKETHTSLVNPMFLLAGIQLKKGRNTLNTMHVARPRLGGEVISGTVDYIYWQSLTLHVDDGLKKVGVWSPCHISRKALRRLSLALPLLPFRIVGSTKYPLTSRQHQLHLQNILLIVINITFTYLMVLLLHVVHHIIIETNEKGHCHWNKSLELRQKINPDLSPLSL